VALLPGLEPLGTVGPDGAWLVIAPGGNRPFCCRYGWQPGPDVVRTTGHLRFPLYLAATASVLEAEADDGRLAPTFHGVAPDPGRPGALRVGTDPVTAEIEGPAGTTVWWSALGSRADDAAPDPRDPRNAQIGPSGSVRVTVFDPAATAGPSDREITLRMWAVTPAGHGYAGSWPVTVDREPPPITLTDPPLVDFEPSVAGITNGAVSLTVDGEPVLVAADGSFTVAVNAGLLPTGIRVVAVDDFGNRAEQMVERVWGLDYRRLPLIPLAVASTLAAGLLLYLRRPHGGGRPPPGEVGTFEEMDG
jgi:hypothetical protein